MKKLVFAGFISLFPALFLVFWMGNGTIVHAAPRLQPTEDKIVIVIDPGHGGENEGTIEAQNFMDNGTSEKFMTMVTAQAMYEELSLYDNVEVYLTRTEDRDLSLKERAQFAAQKGADYLFSIHYNASLEHTLFGSEVWIPAEPPYNAYGYQFGLEQMKTMGDMGLFLRGVKTRLNDEGTDYYGIIRESVALSVPAVIIEHCHVDEDRDIPYCDEREDWEKFGRADALSVAKYFGLSSKVLGVDYSRESTELPEVSGSARVQRTLLDETPPEVCQIELLNAEYDTGRLDISVSSADYDSMLLYYTYSIDGGKTYSSLQPWPDSNVLTGTYTDTFILTLEIPSGVMPSVTVRAYNLFDIWAESNCLQSLEVFRYGEETVQTPEPAKPSETPGLPGTKTFRPANSGNVIEGEKQASFVTFLKICLVFVIILFAAVLFSQCVSSARRRKKRRQRRNDPGNRRNQRR